MINRRSFLKLGAGLGLGALFASLDQIQASLVPAPFPVYLTFEGGPVIKTDGTGTTISILDALEKYKVPATFFVTGKLLSDSHAPVIARMLHNGHAIGNRLYAATGNLAQDQSTASQLAEQYFKTEVRLRTLIAQTDAAAIYDQQPKLYRRPGGDTALATFLDPAQQTALAREPYLKKYVDTMDWLSDVYDYSGWHVSAGTESTKTSTKNSAAQSIALAQNVVNGDKTLKTQGVSDFLCVASNQKRAHEAGQGVIIQLFDSDPIVPDALTAIILQLRDKGAAFMALPRAMDKANSYLVGVEDLPTADDQALACNAQVTAAPTQSATQSATVVATAAITPAGS